MDLENFKSKFNTPRINTYLKMMSPEQVDWFWKILVNIKNIFTDIDIYHAGFGLGYLGFGNKVLGGNAVKDFLFVMHFTRDENKKPDFTLNIADKSFKLLEIKDVKISQVYDEDSQKNELKDWLTKFKKIALDSGLNCHGHNYFPIDYNIKQFDAESDNKEQKDNKKIMKEPLNQIFYGPPGTGKTYATTERAVQIADPEWYASLTETDKVKRHKAIKEKYDELIKAKQIAFTTFHQSFSYEDFIEGLRAYVPESQDKIAYKIEEGVLKNIALDAEKALGINKVIDIGLNESPKIWKISLGETSDTQRRKKYFDQQEARIGWNNSGNLLNERTQAELDYFKSLGPNDQTSLLNFSEEMKVGDVILCLKERISIQAIGVITSDYYFDEEAYKADSDFAHVRKVNWIAKDISLNILSLNNGKQLGVMTVHDLFRMSWAKILDELKAQNIKIDGITDQVTLAHQKNNYVLIIDEINRGNISKIFGELITLIEDDKRSGRKDAREVVLPYSKELFSVPENLYLIGTMNTADKSLTQLDLALRRRFIFEEILPDPTTLEAANQYGFDIVEMLTKINQRIQVLKGKDFQIGHAYFMPLCKVFETESTYLETLQNILSHKILPLLQEYFFSNLECIGLVLNDNEQGDMPCIIEKIESGDSLFPFAETLPKFNPLHSIKLNLSCFNSIERIQQIYNA
jgi:5-methylcytosine-specific restriction enzyme B